MDTKGFEKKPWFPYLKNMYDEIEGDMMEVDAKGYEEKPWWPYVLDLQEKIDAGGGGGSSVVTVTLDFTVDPGITVEGYGSLTTFTVPAGSPPLDMFIGELQYMSQTNIVKTFLGASKYDFGALIEGAENLSPPDYSTVTCTGGVSFDATTHTFSVTGDGTIQGIINR